MVFERASIPAASQNHRSIMASESDRKAVLPVAPQAAVEFGGVALCPQEAKHASAGGLRKPPNASHPQHRSNGHVDAG